MKKYFMRAQAVIMLMCLLCACGPKKEDEKKLNELAGSWELVEFTVNGQTDKAENFSGEYRERLPKFSCSDGESCTFSYSGKSHNGSISGSEGKYVISYEDTDQTMTAELTDGTLIIANEKGTLLFRFKKAE